MYQWHTATPIHRCVVYNFFHIKMGAAATETLWLTKSKILFGPLQSFQPRSLGQYCIFTTYHALFFMNTRKHEMS